MVDRLKMDSPPPFVCIRGSELLKNGVGVMGVGMLYDSLKKVSFLS